MTKIVCTIGPACDDKEVMRALVQNGMDAARINFSHGTYEEHKKRITLLREVCAECGREIPVILDTKGPEIRLGTFKQPVALKKGDTYTLTVDNIVGDEKRAGVTYKTMCQDLKIGSRILIDDGLIELKAEKIDSHDLICRVCNDGVLSDRKGVNLPDTNVNLPSMTEQDIRDILFGIENDFDFIAVSFVRSAADIQAVRRLLDKNGGEAISIIAKIENRQGINNIKEIVHISDGVMVARGDMGVEIPVEEVPVVQRSLIETCFKSGKPVITATQMLDSMIRNPRPTRAEVNDVAQAVYEGTSAIMLSGETAAGKYPVESLLMMSKIALAAEESIDYWARFRDWRFAVPLSVTNAISHSTCTTAMSLKTSAIISVTKSGSTARMISRFRPACPIIGVTTTHKVLRQLSLSWGVYPMLSSELHTTDDLFSMGIEKAVESGLVKHGDVVVITAGIPVGISGTTNLLKVQVAGNALIRGYGIGNETVTGEVCVAKNAEEACDRFNDGDILVMPSTNNDVLQLMKKAKAIIVEDDEASGHAATVAQALDIAVILGAANATDIMKTGTVVAVDPVNGLVIVPD